MTRKKNLQDLLHESSSLAKHITKRGVCPLQNMYIHVYLKGSQLPAHLCKQTSPTELLGKYPL